jgi:hypothetical protein
MAGKKKLGNKAGSGPMLLGGLDLDDVDSLLDDGGSSQSGKRTPTESIRKLATTASRSMRDRVNTKTVLASFIRTALPDGYTRLLGLYDETKQGIESVVDGVEETEFASLEKLAERFENQLPKLKGKVSDAVYERIKAKIEDRKEDYKLRRQIDQAQTARTRGDYDEKSENLSVDQMFDELQMAEDQNELSKAASDVEHNKLDYDVKRDGIRARLDKTRFDVMNRHLGMIADSTQRSSAYNDSVTYQFQKKSLELQMRSYLAMRSMVKLSSESLLLQKQAYTALVHNTGLPEFMKATEAERTKWFFAEQARNPFRQLVTRTASDAVSNFLPGLFNNVGKKAAGLVRGASQVGEGGMGMLLARLLRDPAENGGAMLGDGLASLLHSTFIPMAARKARPTIKRVSDKLTGGGDSRIAYALDNMASISQNFANDASKSTGVMGRLQGLVKLFAPQFRQDDLIKDGTYQTINQSASFNQMTQRSIVEIIPGYLSRILQETRMIRTGDDTIGREVYDITRGQFTQDKKAQDNLGKRIVGVGARRSITWSLNNTVEEFGAGDGQLSPEAKHALEERLLRDAMEGKHFDPVAYVKASGYAPGTDPAVLNELEKFFKRQFKFGEDGKLGKSAANYAKRQEYSTRFNELRDTVRSPIAEIERLLSSGNHTALRDLGIIKTVEGEDRIDYGVLRDMYRDLGDPNASGPLPTPPSPTSPLLTKLRQRLREARESGRSGMRAAGEGGRTRLREAGDRVREGGRRGMRGARRMRDAGQNLVDSVDLPDSAVVRAAVSAQADAARAHVAAAKDRVQDLMIAGRDGVVIKADEILNGGLIDATTQKVITKVEDIKGEVIDLTGRVRLTRADVTQGLVMANGVRLDLLKHLPTKIPPNVLAMLNQQRLSIGNLIRKEDGVVSRVKDLYLEGANDPVIKAAGIRAGEYIDMASQKVIETIDDISGAVARVDRPDEILFTAQEAATKLIDNTGKRFKSSKLLRGLAAATGHGFGVAAGRFKIGMALIRKGGMLVSKLLKEGLDAYLPGNLQPILQTIKLKRGEYYHSDGSVIQSFDDLRDGVYAADGNLLVDPEDIPHLINRDGTQHTTAKRRGFIRKLGKKLLIGAPTAMLKGIGKVWWKGTKAYYKGMGNMFAKKFGSTVKKADDYNKAGMTPTDGILGQILGVIDRRMPKEEAKDGSWQQKMQEAEANAKAKREGKRGKPQDKSMAGGGLLAGLSKLFGKKGEEDEESGGDTNIDFGGGEGGEDKKGKRVRKKPRGRLGRGWDRLAKTKVGRGVGRMGGSALMRAGAGMGARVGGSALLSGAASMFGGSALSGLATGAASVAGSGLAMAGTAAAAAGTAILSVLASPVVLGALAVGGVAAGGYWLWNRSGKVSGDFRELRLMQYGIDSTGDKLKILELEAYLEQFSVKGTEPKLNINGTDPRKVFEILDIDPSDADEVIRMATWIDKRFKPVFFAWLKAMHQLTPHGTLINELDDKLPDAAKYDFFTIVKTVPVEVYQQLVHPLDSDPIEVTPAEINAKVTELIDEWRDKAPAKDERKTGDTTGAVPIKTRGGEETKAADGSKPEDKSGFYNALKTGAMALVPGLAAGSAIGGLIAKAKEGWAGGILSTLGNAAKLVATPALLGGLVLKSAVSMAGVFKAGKLTTLQAVRVRAYGRMQLDERTIAGLFDSEAKVYEQVRFSSDGQAYYNGNLDTLIAQMGEIFAVDVTDPSSRKAQEFTAWILQRFIPTALAYFAAVKQQGQSITPSRVETALKDDVKLSVANAIMTATYELNGENVSIWKANTFFNNGTADLGALKATAEREILVLKAAADKAKLSSPGTSVKEQENQEKSKARTTAEKIMDGASKLGASLKESFSNFASGVKDTVGGAVTKVKDFFGFGGGDSKSSTAAPANTAYSAAYTPGGTLEQKGSTYSAFAEGNGGAWNSIPLPKANKSRDAAMETLRAIQAMTGVDAELLATFASMESNFDYTVKARTSSATGWFQFINSTWDGMLKAHAAKYGIPPDNGDRYLRKDPRINGLMGAEFLKGNYQILAKALGRAPTDTDLYFAHFLGPVTAAGFLMRDRNAIAASFYPAQAAANRSIFYKTTGQPRTIGEVYEIFDGKVRSHRKGGGGSDVGKSPIGQPTAQAQADEKAQASAVTADMKPPADAINGEVGTPTPQGNPNDSLTMTADKTAAPMRMGDPSQSTSTPAAPGGGSSTVVGSGQNTPERQAALNDAMQKAAASDKAATEQNQQKQALASSSVNYLEQQLNTQIEMRDLLKTIAVRLGTPVAAAPAPQAAPAQTGNDMGKQQPSTERRAGNAPTPLSFKR